MTLQQRLGFSADTRVLITHADDIGMCQATVSAWKELVDTGLLSSASAMVPCSWFPAAASAEHELGGAADLGVHLTLTCEWTQYRWGALTAEPSLLDSEGYLPLLARYVHAKADVAAVKAELSAQIQRALDRGIDVTHLDSHMLTMYHPRLFGVMLELAVQHKLPPLIADYDAEKVAKMCVISLEDAQGVVAQYRAAAARGEALLISSMAIMPFNQKLEADERQQWVNDWMDGCGPGVHMLIGHPANDTPELRTIAARDFQTRIADRHLFGSDALRQSIAERGFKLVGMREIREALRQ